MARPLVRGRLAHPTGQHMKMETKAKSRIRMVQIVAAHWGSSPLSYSVIGLDTQGRVWRYDGKCSGWIPWNMEPAICEQPHRR